jgi:carboxypeptidase family protein
VAATPSRYGVESPEIAPMRLSPGRSAIVLLALLGICSTAMPAEAAEGRVHGVVADESGGVLPGVTVVATSGDGRVLATAVTDAVGHYAIGALPAVAVSLTFQLEGFSPAVVAVTVKADSDSVATGRLTLAPRAETVVVVGKTPVYVPPPPRRPPPPPPPKPVVMPVAEHDRDSVCGPAKPGATLESFGTIRSRRHGAENGLYATGDELVVDGGTRDGLEAGQNLVVRRTYRLSGEPGAAIGEHTAGLLQMVAVGERASVGVVVYACDEMMPGDRLASFKPEPVRAPEPAGRPAYDNAARILFADAGQLLGVPRRLMVIDRGSDNGIRVGQRLTLFRRQRSGGGAPAVIGNAVVVAIRIDSATIRVERASDVIAFGDWAAPEGSSVAASAPAHAVPRQPR